MTAGIKYLLKNYKPYPFDIEEIYLNFSIYEEFIDTFSRMKITPKFNDNNDLELQGKNINLKEIRLNNKKLSKGSYKIENGVLKISNIPKETFIIEIYGSINPYTNMTLEGFYSSGGIITTQCEAEGFRRICFHPDRPDVLSKYKVRLESDRNKYPVLLSNGNKLEESIISSDNSRHYVIWEDPFPKPSYLFAVVAGKLKNVTDTYESLSGKTIGINLYVEEGDEHYTSHAIESLKRAMRWDENVYNLEYDLNIYNIVAIRHFNMGAMENKGLNIFNSKLILANANITTDAELERIESVIAHEYFHNWTGNRITCRDWFQLSLKEGLTVYRDQSFTSDLHSSSLKRIEDVSFLRSIQFKEDAGPTSHPVKPLEYTAIDNFYTTTIYEKGAEIIRMLNTLLSPKYFMLGIKKYVNDFDGCAATTEDFVEAVIKGAIQNGYELNFNVEQFIRWYYQAGTPFISIKRKWDEKNNVLKLTLNQSLQTTSLDSEYQPLVIPIVLSILNQSNKKEERTIIFDKISQELEFPNIQIDGKVPIISVFRNFSAPVNWESDLSTKELFYLLENEDDEFSRWDAMQTLSRNILISRASKEPLQEIENLLIDSLRSNILKFKDKNKGLLSSLLKIPSVSELESYQEPIDPISLEESYLYLNSFIGKSLINPLKDLLIECDTESHNEWPQGQEERQLIEVIWKLLIANGNQEVRQDALNAVKGSSMSLSRAALNAFLPVKCIEREEALRIFYEKWKDSPVILDSWFNLQASLPNPDSYKTIKDLLSHPKFDPIAPNSIRAVLGGFAKNTVAFHSSNGNGYMFMADQIIDVDKRNPITASRLSKIFSRWQSYIEPNSKHMLLAIQKLSNGELSSNTREIVEMMLK